MTIREACHDLTSKRFSVYCLRSIRSANPLRSIFPALAFISSLAISPAFGASQSAATGGSCFSLKARTPPKLISSTIIDRTLKMPMKNPPHPGSLVKYDCIEALGLTVTSAAGALGVTRQALSNLINGYSGISPEMAIRLEKAFGGTAEGWLRMQL